MKKPATDGELARANGLLAAGKLDEALLAAQELVAADPGEALAHNLLGTILSKKGDAEAARRAFEASIAADSSSYRAFANLSTLDRSLGRNEQALVAIVMAIEREPSLCRLHLRRGHIERDVGRRMDAVRSFERAFALEPTLGHRQLLARSLAEAGEGERAIGLLEEVGDQSLDAKVTQAVAFDSAGDVPRVEAALARALAMHPPAEVALDLADLAEKHRLGRLARDFARGARNASPADGPTFERGLSAEARALELCGDPDGCLAILEDIVRRNPSEDSYKAWAHACRRAQRIAQLDRAVAESLERYPRSASLRAALAHHYWFLERLERSAELCRQALAIDPDNAAAHGQLAMSLGSAGCFAASRACLRRAVRLAPAYDGLPAWSLFHNLHDDSTSPSQLLDQARAWVERFAVAVETARIERPSPSSSRKVRIGYLSADLRSHAVMTFAMPLLRAHDRSRFDVFCYGLVAKPDHVTDEIRALPLVYRDVGALSVGQIAATIASDGLDILVELSGHTNATILYVLAHQPAPIQVTYLGWPASLGLPEVSVRVTDAISDPPGRSEALHTERLARLPHAMWTFELDDELPIVDRTADAPIVFGSFNRACKLSDPLLRAWARILRAVPGSSLIMKGRSLGDPMANDRIASVLDSEGVARERFVMVGWADSKTQHLTTWSHVDIGLDAFPYAGTTTTCEALWMGVPVVTRTGQAHVSRVGASLLSEIGLQDLVAEDWDGYVDRAVELARDVSRRARLRRSLRETLRRSVLNDGARFTRSFEAALLEVVRGHARSPAAPPDARLTRREPRHHVPRSLFDRETFVAMEAGTSDEPQEAFLRTVVEARAAALPTCDVVLREASLAQALDLATRTEATITLHVTSEVALERGRSSADLHGVKNLAVSAEEPLLGEPSVVQADAEALPSSCRWLARSSHAALVHVVPPRRPDVAPLSARELTDGCVGLWLLPEANILVPVASVPDLGPPPSLFVVNEAGFERLVSEGFAVAALPAGDAAEAQDAGSPAVALWETARSLGEVERARKARLLLDAFDASAAEVERDPIGGRLTRARLAIAIGARSLVASIVRPLIESPALPSIPFLPVEPEPPAEEDDPLDWFARQAILATVLRGGRTSFDSADEHGKLLERYFRLGGNHPEMNRRYGLLLALAAAKRR